MGFPPPAPDSTALVTGASSGIGADMARELTSRGHGVTLAARREERLVELAEELSKAHGVRAEVVACDVADPASRDRMTAEIESRGLTVDALVNNAGFGSAGSFHELDVEREVLMVRTNCEAIIALCGHYLPQMVGRGRGAVLNTASVAGFQPLPTQATYSASKAFVLTFTDALAAELHGTGVTATALCPGPVETEFFDSANMDSLAEKMSFAVVSSEDTARAGIEAMVRGRRRAVPGLANQAQTIAGQFTPRPLLLAAMRRFYSAGR